MRCSRTLAFLLAIPVLGQEAVSDPWARVRSIPPGTRMEISPPGEGTVKGRFDSLTYGSIALRSTRSAIRSVQRSSVERVRVRIPITEREAGWIVSAGIAGFMLGPFPYLTPGTASPWARGERNVFLLVVAAVTVPASLLVLHMTRWKVVCRLRASGTD
ncbi:MAG: hypothetical protein OXN89_23280 [Bryobacterales bacterium]|nr:hypothetical protein [Bryobacterales bacterium]